jgi:two-component system nitrate/nitrite response regulator NarL
MTDRTIRVTILDDHQSIIDGYLYRLKNTPSIEVVSTLAYGEELEPALKEHPTDVLLLDVSVPTSADNTNPYPILHVIPKLLQIYPNLAILVISMHAERGLIRAVIDAGASGYILKDDQAAIQGLGSVVISVAGGGIFLSQRALQFLTKHQTGEIGSPLTARQLEALSLCLAYPNSKTEELAYKMSVSNSTVRNLLSNAYLRLGVHTRAGALAKARQLGLITPDTPTVPSPRK